MMKPTFRFRLFLVAVLALLAGDCQLSDVATLLSYDITNAQSYSENINSLVNQANADLVNHGILVIPKFLSTQALHRFQAELEEAAHVSEPSFRTIFQDTGDLINFPSNSSRNLMFEYNIDFVPRMNLRSNPHRNNDSQIIALYEWQPLLSFWRRVAHDLSDVYLSNDAAGSVYGLYGYEHNSAAWHFDETPFSCVFMIQRAQIGGNLRYVLMENPLTIHHSADNDGLQQQKRQRLFADLDSLLIRNGSIAGIHEIHVDNGDVYCFFGNQTLHEVTAIEGPSNRVVIVMGYGNTEHFVHSDNVNGVNEWQVTRVTRVTNAGANTISIPVSTTTDPKSEL